MLIDEHSDGDAAHVEAVQEVLDVLASDGVLAKGLLVLDDTLCHSGYHVIVPVPNRHQRVHKPARQISYVDHNARSMRN